MTEQKKDFPEFYVTSPQPCPYLAGRLERKLFTHLTHDKPAQMIDNLLRGGFRRSQNIAYIPYCEGCSACVSVRVPVDTFQASRSQRRTGKHNQDVTATRVAAIPTSEQYALFRRYIDNRHFDGGMADMSVLDYAMMIEDTNVQTFMTEYRTRTHLSLGDEPEDGQLIAVALSDLLSDGISMVYSYFDTSLSDRSLGTYMVMEHITYARTIGLPYIYLGYWIDGSRKMSYKDRFRPQEHLSEDGWISASEN